MKKSLTIKARIGITVGLLAVLAIGIGAIGLYGMKTSNAAFANTYSNEMPSMLSAGSSELYTARERLDYDRAVMLIGTPDAEAAITRGLSLRAQADAFWKQYAALPQGSGEAALADASQAKRLAVQALIDKGYAAVRANDKPAALDAAKTLQQLFFDFAESDTALLGYQSTGAKAGYQDATSTASTIRTLSIVAILLGIVAAVFSWVSLSRAIGRPLAEALEHFDAIAEGDLQRNVRVHSDDEMGQLMAGLDKMQKNLAKTVQTVRSGSESIASATKQISAGNTDLSSRTEEQASALQETAASMDELTSTVKQNADNARQASALASSASDIANKGSTVVSQVVGTMSEINQSSNKIADIITIIEGIAFQTNILALNAAVEAARAGEEGRGFAVVAGEVRNLAQRSSAAAKEIKELIDTSVERVQSGTALVDEAGKTMNDIIGAVRRVTDIMGEIAAASQEQSAGIEQVALAVTQMDEATQQNAALVEEAAAAAQSLEDQADKLRGAMAVFQVDGMASGSRASVSAIGTASMTAPKTVPAPVRGKALSLARVAPKSAPLRRPVAAPVMTSPTAGIAAAPVLARAATSSNGDWESF